jgi:hypothetical protein
VGTSEVNGLLQVKHVARAFKAEPRDYDETLPEIDKLGRKNVVLGFYGVI